MQIVEINLIDGYPFYCPITGHQILTKDDFTPSPAMKYCYIQDEGCFEVLSKEAKKYFNPKNEDDHYFDYEEYDKIFSLMMTKEDNKDWICFRICSGQNFDSLIVDHCIDMSYRD